MKPFSYIVPKSLDEAHAAAAQPNTLIKGAGLDIVDLSLIHISEPTRPY